MASHGSSSCCRHISTIRSHLLLPRRHGTVRAGPWLPPSAPGVLRIRLRRPGRLTLYVGRILNLGFKLKISEEKIIPY